MHFVIKIFFIFALSDGLAAKPENHQIQSLEEVIGIIEKKVSIETILVLSSQNNNNCSLQDWNPPFTSILRSNEQGKIAMRGKFNSRALALICISEESDLKLLKTAARAFDHMRQEQVILWIQRKFSKQILEEISKEVSRFKFSHVLALHVENHLTELVTIHRWDACRYPHFIKVDDTAQLHNFLSQNKPPNFCGATAVVKVTPVTDISSLIKRFEVAEFALKYNLKLSVFESNDPEIGLYDIHLNAHFLSKQWFGNHISFSNPLRLSSLIVIVPCGQERSLKDVYKQLDVRKWLLYIFLVYVALVLAETGIVLVTHRISGSVCQPTRLISLVNLSAIRAILGMSFPISRRASLSLRQLFLAMSLFGMVFSSFFGCKLSALLTKDSQKPRASNFKELRNSGLTVIVDPDIHYFIKAEMQADFFQIVMPKVQIMKTAERANLIFSLNDTYGFVILEENWIDFNKYQLSMGRKAFCTTKDLTIIRNLPRVNTMQRNSIYKKPLSMFISRIEESGIPMQWKTMANMTNLTNLTLTQIKTPNATPLGMQQLKWLGYLLILGYGVAAVVFLFEICLHRKKIDQLSAV